MIVITLSELALKREATGNSETAYYVLASLWFCPILWRNIPLKFRNVDLSQPLFFKGHNKY